MKYLKTLKTIRVVGKYLITLFLLLSIKSYSQKLQIDTVNHKINLHLTEIKSNDPEILTLRPINKIKITFKAGLNASNDLDLKDCYQMVGYEYRVKYYVNSKLRLIFRDQVLTLGQNNYSFGVQLKF